MNDLIEKLAEQAMVTLPAIEGSLSHTYFDKEKFAELIVRECIEQCTANDSNDEWDKGVRWAANQIKEHFGVEE